MSNARVIWKHIQAIDNKGVSNQSNQSNRIFHTPYTRYSGYSGYSRPFFQ
jgi:hypothetical protein